MNDGAVRPVTCSCIANSPEPPSASCAERSTTPGEPTTSSAVPVTPSAPGLIARAEPTTERGSDPPRTGWWQLPHATVRLDDSCSSQNSTLPRFAFAAVIGLPAGTGGGGSGVSGGGGGGGGGAWADAAAAHSASTSIVPATRFG